MLTDQASSGNRVKNTTVLGWSVYVPETLQFRIVSTKFLGTHDDAVRFLSQAPEISSPVAVPLNKTFGQIDTVDGQKRLKSTLITTHHNVM